MLSGVRRLDIGGKLLTKMLSKMVSLKQFRVDGYFQTVNQMKERVCYVSNNVKNDLLDTKSNKIFYVLPDPDIGTEGYVTETVDS